MVEIKTDSDILGQVQISDEVIAIIAGTAAMEVDGVTGTGSTLTNDLAGMLSGKKNFSKGVKVEVVDDDVSVDIEIMLKFGAKAKDIALEVQKRVKNAIETMTGLNVVEANVNVSAVNFDKE